MTPANDNTPRPASFDQLLLQYDGFIRAKCRAYPDPDDLYQAVMLRALSRWATYRPQGKFASWIGYQIRSAFSEPQRRAKRGEKYPYFASARTTEPNQELATDISMSMALLDRTEREVISLLAVGFDGAEVGKIKGISRQRVFQIAKQGREWLAANDNVPARKAA